MLGWAGLGAGKCHCVSTRVASKAADADFYPPIRSPAKIDSAKTLQPEQVDGTRWDNTEIPGRYQGPAHYCCINHSSHPHGAYRISPRDCKPAGTGLAADLFLAKDPTRSFLAFKTRKGMLTSPSSQIRFGRTAVR